MTDAPTTETTRPAAGVAPGSLPCRLVIFDFDGTLSDSGDWFLSIADELADRFKFKHVTDDEVESAMRLLFSATHNVAEGAGAIALAPGSQRLAAVLHVARVFHAVDAQRLAEELRWFAPQARVKLLPDWETLPYDHFSPHQDLVSERLATLHHIRSTREGIAAGASVGGRRRIEQPGLFQQSG